MPKALSIGIRDRILKNYDLREMNRQEVADRFMVSLGVVKKLIQQRKKLGHVRSLHHRCGNKSKITHKHKEQFQEMLIEKSDLTLEELKAKLNLDCSIQSIHYALASMGMSYKKKLSDSLSKPEKTSK